MAADETWQRTRAVAMPAVLCCTTLVCRKYTNRTLDVVRSVAGRLKLLCTGREYSFALDHSQLFAAAFIYYGWFDARGVSALGKSRAAAAASKGRPSTPLMFVDSHAHIDGPEFDADRHEVLQRARGAGVSAILNVGTGDPHSGALERAVELAEKHEGLYSAIGTHPHDARLFDNQAEQRITDLIKQSARVIAWGEMGLDFHYDNSPRDVQMDVFRRQLQLARAALLPVIIHTREAEAETIQILRSEWQGSGLPGIMHCFSGTSELAEKAFDLGMFISFSGIVTFKNADDLRRVATEVPLGRLLIETDCPYLSPVPYRGKRNEPAYVVEVARCLAELRGVSLEEMGRITAENFARVFKLDFGSD